MIKTMLTFLTIVSFSHCRSLETINVEKKCNGDFCIPRVVWSYWDNDTLTKDIQEMVDITRKSLKDFSYFLLTPKNVSQYLDVDKFPKEYNNLLRVSKSEYIRVCLLSKFGGAFVDASVYINNGTEMELIFDEVVSKKSPVYSFPSFSIWSFNLTLAFFGTAPNSNFIKAFKKEFDVALKSDHKKYVNDTCRLLPPKAIKENKCVPYSLSSIVLTKIFSENKAFKSDVLVLPAEKSVLRLIRECNDGKECFSKRLFRDPVARAYPFIKVPRYARYGVRYQIGDPTYTINFNKTSFDYSPIIVVNPDVCGYVFDVLGNSLDKSIRVAPPTFEDETYPLNIMWYVGRRVMGNSGNFNPMKIYNGLKDYALKSAKKTHGYPGVSKNDFKKLKVRVSLEHSFERCNAWNDWEVGTHGIRVALENYRGSTFRGAYLPEVMYENGFNQEKSIELALMKGGFRGEVDDEVKAKVQITRYQTYQCNMTYSEYQQWKNTPQN